LLNREICGGVMPISSAAAALPLQQTTLAIDWLYLAISPVVHAPFCKGQIMTSTQPLSRRHTLKAALFALAAATLTVTALPAVAAPVANIVGTAVGSADHTTLVAAVKAAGLVDTLSSKGPFTVFAPTNAAFAKLPAGTVDNLLKPENKAKLANILTYHVVSGKAMASDLKDGQELTTVQGGKLKVSIKDGKVMINDAHVTSADVHASNGIVHVVDKVILPKA
jgi:uncharacterized surface protein with fasciclin (FAS1) repeats